MPLPVFTGLGPEPEFEDVVNKLNSMAKELQVLMVSLDTQNVSYLSADVIKTGVLGAEFVSIGHDTIFEDGYDPSQVQQNIDDLSDQLGELAFEDAVQLAMLGTTIIQGGYLATGLVHAGRIDTGVLNANRIGAKSISTEKLLVGSYDNLVDNPNFANGMMPHIADMGNWAVTQNGSRVEGGWCLSSSGGNPNEEMRVYFGGDHVLEVEPGESYYMSFWARKTGSGPHNDLTLTFRVLDGDRNYINFVGVTTYTSSDLPSAQYVKVETVATMPENAAYAAPTIRIRPDGNNQNFRIANVYVRRMVDGHLMVGRIDTGQVTIGGTGSQRSELLSDQIRFFSDDAERGHIKAEYIEDWYAGSPIGETLVVAGEDSLSFMVDGLVGMAMFRNPFQQTTWMEIESIISSNISVGWNWLFREDVPTLDLVLEGIGGSFSIDTLTPSTKYFVFDDQGTGSQGGEPTLRPSDTGGWGYIGTSNNPFFSVYAANLNQTSTIEDKESVSDPDKNHCYDLIKDLKVKKYLQKKGEKSTSEHYRVDKKGNKTKQIRESHDNKSFVRKEKFGLIAEESPSEVLDDSGKAVNLYSFISIVAGAVQDIQNRLEMIEDEQRK